ncbi:MAG: type III pantothenate kinase [Bacteroidetes bacterium]|nr:MAG: type III pantothenate kinase [Bacteroidota bacterium]REK04989.1 MAG: type III pantothenate kinase [Bacteroidota bacterium]REK36507.1 MAG: type III pantothenate kinase [Bacteroidota bacterium]REK51720.1 MAG: type III pantothenate kinase [Bacteroidota bacterium]
MNLTVDQGNTNVKVLVFENETILFSGTFRKLKLQDLRRLLKRYDIQASILSSVVKNQPGIISLLKRETDFILLSHKTKVPLKLKYKSPQTLGMDRLASAAAAVSVFPGQNVLVIDAGTCVKYDFVNRKKEYLGGSISPGLVMRLKSMNHYTHALPMLEYSRPEGLTGKTTDQSMLSGVHYGMLSEMEGMISRYRKQHEKLKVIFTGRDSVYFVKQLNLPIFAAPDLIGLGLNHILNFNVSNK